MATSTREARRRRIVDRGEDRLALITGRIKTLDSSPLPPLSPSPSEPQPNPVLELKPQLQSEHTRTISSPPVLSRRDNIQSRSGPIIVDSSDGVNDNGIRSIPNPKPSIVNETSSNASTRYGDQVEHQLHTSEGNVEEIRSPALGIGNEKQPKLEHQLHTSEGNVEEIRSPASGISNEKKPKLVASTVVEDSSQSTPSDTTPLSHAAPRSHHPTLFTPKRISSAIAASENFRVICSVTIALLVILSHLNLPILSGSEVVKNFMMSMPLYLVLLADFTIVVALLLLAKRGSPMKAVEEANSRAMNVGEALETGIVMYKAFRAVFMDCSVYAVVLISGLSLLQTFRS
ncbi:hypothetical protein C5167_035219 [Papaver somniferum]|uniref:Uncharacterized protein n=1 Tax=Papaver somniferum TaxID=3469 RepID=A0A4Y7KFU3_PAPSO|nr:uncharacterized protein LOC113299811 [Papaver somniferum]RZC71716.1 hypothetical protein C5167_035219 [Papaver somniferum]